MKNQQGHQVSNGSILYLVRKIVQCSETRSKENYQGLASFFEVLLSYLSKEQELDYIDAREFKEARDILISALERLKAGKFGKEDIKAEDYNFSDFEAFKSFVDICKAA